VGRLDFEGDHFGFFGGSTRGTGTANLTHRFDAVSMIEVAPSLGLLF
jgi:hypothetical protein